VLEMGVVRLTRAAALVDVAELAVRVEALLAGGRLPGRSGGSGTGSAAPAGASGGPASPAFGAPSGRSATAHAISALTGPPPARSVMPPPAPTPPPVAPSPALAAVALPAVVQRPANLAEAALVLADADLPRWIEALMAQSMGLVASLLESAVVQESSPGYVRLGMAMEFLVERASHPEALGVLAAAAHAAFGGTWRVEIGGVDARARTHSLGALRQRAQSVQRQSTEADLRAHPGVLAVVQALQGEIVSVLPDSALPAGPAEA